MECRDCQLQIDQYLSGMLPPLDFVAFTEHMNSCQHCREQVNSHKYMNELIIKADVPVPPIDIVNVVMDKIRTESKILHRVENVKISGSSRRRFASLLQDLVAAAAAAIIIFWLSGPVLARTEVPQYSHEVAKVSNSVGIVFKSYLNFYDLAFDKLSNSVNEIDRGQSKGVEGF